MAQFAVHRASAVAVDAQENPRGERRHSLRYWICILGDLFVKAIIDVVGNPCLEDLAKWVALEWTG